MTCGTKITENSIFFIKNDQSTDILTFLILLNVIVKEKIPENMIFSCRASARGSSENHFCRALSLLKSRQLNSNAQNTQQYSLDTSVMFYNTQHFQYY